MLRLEHVWEGRNRGLVMVASCAIIVVLAVADWRTQSYIALGFLYLFPIMLLAGILPRWAIILLSIVCAVLSEAFSSLNPAGGSFRLAFEALAFIGCGLLVAEMVRNRRLTTEAQERLR